MIQPQQQQQQQQQQPQEEQQQNQEGPTLEDLLKDRNDFERESFSFVRQLVDLRNFAVRYIETEDEYEEFQISYMMRMVRDQSVKIRKLFLEQRDSCSVAVQRERLEVSSKCLIFILERLDFLYLKLDGVQTFNGFSQAETRFHEEYQRDEGMVLDLGNFQERDNLSPFARSFAHVPDEPCACMSNRPPMDHEGVFLKTMLCAKPDLSYVRHFDRFLREISKLKEKLGQGDYVPPKSVHKLLLKHFNFNKYMRDCKDVRKDDLLNQFLLAFCLLLTRRVFYYACCATKTSICRTSLRLDLRYNELFSDCSILRLL